jgi:hypothetical protein
LLTSIPVTNLLVILVGMPLAATVLGWLLAGPAQSASPASRSDYTGHKPGVLDSPLFAE